MIEATLETVSPAGMMPWLNDQMVKQLQESMQNRFDSGGDDAVGGEWVPLSEATLQIKEDQGYPEDINIRTGEMLDFLTSDNGTVNSEGFDSVLEYPGNTASADVAKKIEVAMLGLDEPATPPRPVLGLGEADLQFAIMSLAAYINVTVAAKSGASPDSSFGGMV